tara:strand:+ start:1450 stop:2658 length:1209 start_codon:yes stop_codon:yes gene_type:complete
MRTTFQIFQPQQSSPKRNNIKFYSDLELCRDFKSNFKRTWNYHPAIDNAGVEYAFIYANGKNLSEVCPDHLKGSWELISERMKSYIRSFEKAKVDLRSHNIYSLIPEKFLIRYGEVKSQITDHVFENYPRPENYDFLLSLHKLLEQIKRQKLKINLQPLKNNLTTLRARKLYRNTYSGVSYNLFGTKTGRLTTAKNSFPILTLNKEHRAILEPNNDWYVEMDFNAAELRTLLALSGKQQPREDIHEWNVKHVYQGHLTREQAKERIFAWLYNPGSEDHLSEGVYERESVLEKYWDGSHVKTFFDRKIEADEHHALNYIIQSTASDLFLRRMVQIGELLENRKTNIAFGVHDSLVLDFSAEDKDILKELINVFASTDLGKFKVNLKAGKNFGNMVKLGESWTQ